MTSTRREIQPSDLTSAQLRSATDDLELIARTVVEGFLQGLHQSPFIGCSVEFASHREYMPGDDLRYVNWRLFGRHERLFVKEFDAETNLELHLIVDASRSMTAEDKWLTAVMIAASLSQLASKQRDAVGLTLFGQHIEDHLGPRNTADHRLDILHTLARSRKHPPSESARVLHEVAELVPRRGLKVLISDCYFEHEELQQALQHFQHLGHELILFHILTPLEQHLPVSGPIRFKDLETGEEIITQAEQIRSEFTATVAAWQQQIEKQCGVCEFDYVPVSTATPLAEVLREYCQKRSRAL